MAAGRQFLQSDDFCSQYTRPAVEAVKKFRDELSEDDIVLLATLVKMQNVPK